MKRKRVLTFLVAGVIVALLAAVGFLAWQLQKADKNSASDAQKTSARVIAKVSELYLLPTNEEPTVALIQDKNKLENQEFFKNARNGDYLLIYQKDKLALVYREKDDKLINVGPVNIGGQQEQAAGAQAESTPQAQAEE